MHLDVDIYDSTSKALAFFYPRMTRGALLISHDYMWAEGVKRAFDEFRGQARACHRIGRVAMRFHQNSLNVVCVELVGNRHENKFPGEF